MSIAYLLFLFVTCPLDIPPRIGIMRMMKDEKTVDQKVMEFILNEPDIFMKFSQADLGLTADEFLEFLKTYKSRHQPKPQECVPNCFAPV